MPVRGREVDRDAAAPAGVVADLEATAVPIVDREARTEIIREILAQLKPGVPAEWMPGMSEAARAATEESFVRIAADPEAVLSQWLDESPLVEIRLAVEPRA